LIPSQLYFCDLNSGLSFLAGTLAGQAAGATFDQSTGQYLYIENRTDNLKAVNLNAEDGTIETEVLLSGDFSGTDDIAFRGGDIAVDCNRILYGSSLGSNGGSKVFFKIQLGNGNAYMLIHDDGTGDNSNTGYATAKQLAFGNDETLFSQTDGYYWTVDLITGEQTPSGTGDGIAIPGEGPLAMTDLASGLDCAACTLTLGYWKNHSEYGPAPFDETWTQLPNDADTLFFDTKMTYYEILSTPPKKGNAYLILAHQYIAAELNILSGASIPSEVSEAMAAAQELLIQFQEELIILNDPDRADALYLAETLDRYNNGYIGPGHCSEN
jgi:hypothetical protein